MSHSLQHSIYRPLLQPFTTSTSSHARLAHTSDISPKKPSIVCLSTPTTPSPSAYVAAPPRSSRNCHSHEYPLRHHFHPLLHVDASSPCPSRQPAHAFSPARPLRAQRKVAGGGGDVVFLLGPILTDLAPAQSFATTNALCPATRFGTDDATTIMETRDAFRESDWRWLRPVEQRLTVFPSWRLGQGRRGRWHGNKARPFEVRQEIVRDLVGLNDVEVWTSKLSWTRSAVIFIRHGATLGDDHGEVEARLFGRRDNPRYSSWAVVGTRVSSWAELRSRFSSRSSSGRVLGFSP